MTKNKKHSPANDIVRGLKNAAAFLDGKPVKARVHVPGAVNVSASGSPKTGNRFPL